MLRHSIDSRAGCLLLLEYYYLKERVSTRLSTFIWNWITLRIYSPAGAIVAIAFTAPRLNGDFLVEGTSDGRCIRLALH